MVLLRLYFKRIPMPTQLTGFHHGLVGLEHSLSVNRKPYTEKRCCLRIKPGFIILLVVCRRLEISAVCSAVLGGGWPKEPRLSCAGAERVGSYL